MIVGVRMRWVIGVCVVAVLAVGCAQQQRMMWVRADGQSGPTAATQFEMDRAACEGEMQKANLSGSSYCRGFGDCLGTSIARGQAMTTVGKGCMASKGYLERPDPSQTPQTVATGPGPGNITPFYEPK